MNESMDDAQEVLVALRSKQRMSEYDLEKRLGGDPDRLYAALDELDSLGYIHWENGEVILLKAGEL